ncbi:hypothetical protein AMECASPLE_027729 [Ameca splendens]|uniref:Uncharacterized protein n=1 Tax=Ameca splendens TaxID=208324 RepID=A0ABV0XUB7_9TELE
MATMSILSTCRDLQAPEREGEQPLSSSLLMPDVSPGVLQAQRQSADARCQRQGHSIDDAHITRAISLCKKECFYSWKMRRELVEL